MKITINYGSKSYGNALEDDPVDVTISSGSAVPFYSELQSIQTITIHFAFTERSFSGTGGSARLRGGLLELPTEDARKLATAILWHLEQPERKEVRLKFRPLEVSDDDNAD